MILLLKLGYEPHGSKFRQWLQSSRLRIDRKRAMESRLQPQEVIRTIYQLVYPSWHYRRK